MSENKLLFCNISTMVKLHITVIKKQSFRRKIKLLKIRRKKSKKIKKRC